VIFVGCEDLETNSSANPNSEQYQGREIWGAWQPDTGPNAPPIIFRRGSFGNYANGFWNKFQIQNVSSSKLHIVGLATFTESNHFIDLQQPGAFVRTLYPQDITEVVIQQGFQMFNPTAFTGYLKIQDWKLEN